MKLWQAVRDHDQDERRFHAAVHGVALADRHGQLPGLSGRRMGAMARAKARRQRGH